MSAFAAKPTLVGERATLPPFRLPDVDAMAEAIADPDVRRLTGTPDASFDIEQLRAWYGARNEQTDRLDLAIVDTTTGGCVGEIVLNEYEAANDSCNFRILIGPRGRDRGLGSEATWLLVDYGFAHLPLHRIGLEVYAFNPPAQRVYEKAGFMVEGVKRDALKIDGGRVDAIVMAVLATD